MDTERSWADLTADEKLEQRFQFYTSPRLPFVSPEAEAEYKARAARLRDAILLQKAPDRVPVTTLNQFYPADRAGFTPYDVMYDPEKAAEAWVSYARSSPTGCHGGIGHRRGRRRADLRRSRLQALQLARPRGAEGSQLPVRREGVDAPRGVRRSHRRPHRVHAAHLHTQDQRRPGRHGQAGRSFRHGPALRSGLLGGELGRPRAPGGVFEADGGGQTGRRLGTSQHRRGHAPGGRRVSLRTPASSPGRPSTSWATPCAAPGVSSPICTGIRRRCSPPATVCCPCCSSTSLARPRPSCRPPSSSPCTRVRTAS